MSSSEAKKGKLNYREWIEIIRTLLRPIITIFLIVLLGWTFFSHRIYTPDQLHHLYVLNLISITFWFGERAFKNLGLNLSKNN